MCLQSLKFAYIALAGLSVLKKKTHAFLINH